MTRYELAKKYTEKYRAVLKPCSVCGNADIRVVTDRLPMKTGNFWSVACSTPRCDCTDFYKKVTDAVNRWNEKN